MEDHLILLGIAALNVIGGAIGFLTLWYTRRTERNTNSMKDALVKATRLAAHAAGREEMRLESEHNAET